MNKYQLTILINEKVSEADRKETFDAVKKSFSNLIKEDLWGVRSLAYDIKHANKAFYAYFEFEAEPEAVITLDKNIRLNEDIIRYLLIRVENKKIRKTFKKETPAEKKEAEKVESKAEVSKAPAEAVEKAEAEAEVNEAPAEAVKEKKPKAMKVGKVNKPINK